VRAKPEMAVAYYNRSLCYARQGKAKLASADRARALKLDPALARAKK
jgi:Tfp pilus assembly protein PilF